MSTIPLPEPGGELTIRGCGYWGSAVHDGYTADQMEAYAAAREAAAIERCAALCDRIEAGTLPDGSLAAGVAWECADAIRALKTQEHS
jgi:hypothetical protein